MKIKFKIMILLLFFLVFPLTFEAKEIIQEERYDLIIKQALIYDGSLNSPFTSDIAIKGDSIVKIGRNLQVKAKKTIEAKGLIATPGFIDLHTHVDEGMYFPENRACLNFLYQGVTSVVVGQCGSSAWPLFEKASDVIEIWTKEGIGPNAALLIGHGTVRRIVMGMENRAPSPEELEKMKILVREAMEQGACGLSTGLIYAPGSFAKTDEIIELAKIVASYGGIYHTHIRNERDRLLEAISEAITIGEKAGLPVHISHFKVLGKSNWGLVKKATALIEEAKAKGLKITADQYPFRFSNNYPYQYLIPRQVWVGDETDRLRQEDIEKIFDYLRDDELINLYKKITPYFPLSAHHEQFLQELPRKRLVNLVAGQLIDLRDFQGPSNLRERRLFLARLSHPEAGKKIREAVRQNLENYGPENIFVAICPEKQLEGKSLAEVAKIKNKPIEEVAIELDLMEAKCIPFTMAETDLEYIMKKEYVGTGSDGEAPFFGLGLPHIRSYATFLYKIKKYALEKKVVSLAHVIRSQTSLPAAIMNWPDRGWLKEGYKADIVLLDLDKLETPATITNPHQYAKGVVYLIINGQTVIEKGRYTGLLPGRVLLRKTN
ncbi:MAG: D-aminoacylase [Candidatus Aminicenantes bacterium]|nr:D-aminoacylase [Candidatus Aminicenantes bacterium]